MVFMGQGLKFVTDDLERALGLPNGAITSAGSADAAIAVAAAWRFCVTFTLRCHRRHVFVGANIPPPRHMLPKAPAEPMCVPDPLIRGIRDTARPVPQDAAAYP